MKRFYVVKGARSLCIGFLVAILMLSLLPMQAARAQEAATTDLAVNLVSIPKHAKACRTFEAVYTVTNLGPGPASQLYLNVGIPDAYEIIDIAGMPESLAVGETATVTVTVKVVLFVPGEMRLAWVNVTLEPSMDLNPDNNIINTNMKLIGKPVEVCS